jgi:dephospho-CoA kinase
MKLTHKQALVIGVAGVMGSGKTTVARVFEGLGASRLDADEIGKALLKDDGIKRQVVDAFGKGVLDKKGEIDPARLGASAFASAESTGTLNRLTRGPLLSRIREEIDRLRQSASVIVVDAALLPEWGSPDWVDLLLVVDSDEGACVERSCAGSRFDAPDVLARMSRQMSRREKARQADIVIPNYGTLDELRKRAEKVYLALIAIPRKGG